MNNHYSYAQLLLIGGCATIADQENANAYILVFPGGGCPALYFCSTGFSLASQPLWSARRFRLIDEGEVKKFLRCRHRKEFLVLYEI